MIYDQTRNSPIPQLWMFSDEPRRKRRKQKKLRLPGSHAPLAHQKMYPKSQQKLNIQDQKDKLYMNYQWILTFGDSHFATTRPRQRSPALVKMTRTRCRSPSQLQDFELIQKTWEDEHKKPVTTPEITKTLGGTDVFGGCMPSVWLRGTAERPRKRFGQQNDPQSLAVTQAWVPRQPTNLRLQRPWTKPRRSDSPGSCCSLVMLKFLHVTLSKLWPNMGKACEALTMLELDRIRHPINQYKSHQMFRFLTRSYWRRCQPRPPGQPKTARRRFGWQASLMAMLAELQEQLQRDNNSEVWTREVILYVLRSAISQNSLPVQLHIL